MEANLQAYEKDMIRELRQAGVLVSDTQSVVGGLGFLFPGHGTHSSTMFDTYLKGSSSAGKLIEMADEVVNERCGYRLTDAVRGNARFPIEHPCVTQPAIFTAALGGALMAEEYSLHPSLLVGHSLGEYAALVCSGVLTAETGLRMVIDRAECVADIPQDRRGAMLAVLLDDDSQIAVVRRAVAAHASRGAISVGVINSPRQVVVSGEHELVISCREELKRSGVSSTLLPIGVGFHSAVLAEAVAPFEERLKQYSWTAPMTPVVSSVFGGYVDSDSLEALPSLLAAQLITQFDFRNSLKVAQDAGVDMYLDCGPRSVLSKLVSSQMNLGDVSVTHLDYGPAHADRTRDVLTALSWVRSGSVAPTDVEVVDAQGEVFEAPGSGVVEETRDGAGVDKDAVCTALREAFAERTGYPLELIEADLDLEADLGIDSVKRVEVVGHVGEVLGVDVKELDFSQALSVSDIAEVLVGSQNVEVVDAQGEVFEAPGSGVVEETRDGAGVDKDAVCTALREAFAERTGYPLELIEADLDLEADLGIDSVKRVEVVGHVGEVLGVDVKELDFSQALSVSDIAEVLVGSQNVEVVDAQRTEAGASDAQLDSVTIGYEDESSRTAHRYVPQSVRIKSLGAERTILPGDAILITAADQSVNDAVRKVLEELSLTVIEIPGDASEATIKRLTSSDRLRRVSTVVDLSVLRPHADILSKGDAWWQDVEGQYTTVFSVAQATYETLQSYGEHASWIAVTSSGGMSGMDLRTVGDPIGGLTAGFVKTLALELRQMHTRIVDFDVVEPSSLAGALRTELTHEAENEEIEIGYIEGDRYTVRVLPVPVSSSDRAVRQSLSTDSCVVMSGGSRGIVRECALALAEQRNIPVVLLGRSDPDDPEMKPWLAYSDEDWANARAEVMRQGRTRRPEASVADLSDEYRKITYTRQLVTNLADIDSRTDKIHYLVCDVSDPDQVDKAMAQVRSRFGKISAIVHGAGLESFGAIPRKSLKKTAKAIAVKARGFQNLLRSTAEDDLSAFISFGSISGRFGMDGQSDYTAGASLLAQMAHIMSRSQSQNPRTIPFITMEWTAWDEVGMATNPEVVSVQANERGMTYMSVADGVRHFVDEIELGTANPEVLYFGELGKNRPAAQVPELTKSGTQLSELMDNSGMIVNRSSFPMVDYAETTESGLQTTRVLWTERDRYLPDHLVKGTATFPGVLHFETQIETALLLAGDQYAGIELEQLDLQTFLKCRDRDHVTIHVDAKRVDEKRIATELTSVFRTPNGDVLDPRRPQSSATFRLLDEPVSAKEPVLDIEHIFDDVIGEFDIDKYYALTDSFISFGPTFRYLNSAFLVDENIVVGELQIPGIPGLFSDVADPNFRCNPILVDNVGRFALMRQLWRNGQYVVPTQMKSARMYRCPQVRERCFGKMTVLEDYEDGFDMRLDIVDENGYLLCTGEHIRLTAIGSMPEPANILSNTISSRI
ncbi:SDR family oxidoreductase [Actinomyces naeslundii]|uniref:SDR family oxidoreductase n=1 Tax=Actinomyces naeslundii TaxID=1655 RepID=UPI003F9F1FBC